MTIDLLKMNRAERRAQAKAKTAPPARHKPLKVHPLIRESQAFLVALKSGQETRFEDQYMRMSPQFETGDRELRWLTDTLWLAEGRLAGDHQIEYQIYRVD